MIHKLGINKQDIIPVYFDIGHKYAKYEMAYINKSLPETYIINDNRFGSLLEKLDAHIPNRNAILILLADAYFHHPVKENVIYLGGVKDDNVEDNNKLFSSAMTTLLQIISKSYVKSVFDYSLTKVDIVDWYIKNDIGTIDDLVSNTFSCYSPVIHGDHHCYACPACFRRNVALSNYIILPFYNNEIIEKYYQRAKAGYYDEKRNQQILHYIGVLRDGQIRDTS
jgi:7-cyano-7-deazaguanine synthase in queuosine biosynthesis